LFRIKNLIAMDITELIGKRALVYTDGLSSFRAKKVEEIKFIELSPSGMWAKLMNMHGNKYWCKASDITMIEPLADLSTGKPKI